MHIFDTIKIDINHGIKVQFFLKLVILTIIIFIINFYCVNDIHSYTRIMLNEMYNDGYIDILFLGPSSTYLSFDISIIEKETGLNAFNAGTTSQNMQGSYYLLKEANESNGIRTVFLNVSYNNTLFHLTKPLKKQTYLITDYLRNKSVNKWDYLYTAFGIEGILNEFLPFLHGSSFSPRDIKEHITGNYKNNSYKYVSYDNEAYYGQGFVYSFDVLDKNYVFDGKTNYIDPGNLISDFTLNYLFKIIEYCKKHNIELVLVIPPNLPDAALVAAQNFQRYVDAISKIAKDNNIELMNFSLAKKSVLTMERIDYKDHYHLNGLGAEKFSKCFCRIINKEILDPFYSTYDQKLINNPDDTVQ
ncbi:MAG: hypothetical protein Q4C78_04840 [Synergistaceae bacterium]|nr:hypothetical protein [Synergistaceae bacterium]